MCWWKGFSGGVTQLCFHFIKPILPKGRHTCLNIPIHVFMDSKSFQKRRASSDILQIIFSTASLYSFHQIIYWFKFQISKPNFQTFAKFHPFLLTKRKKSGRDIINSEMMTYMQLSRGFPGGTSGKETACQCMTHEKCGFSPWVGKIP